MKRKQVELNVDFIGGEAPLTKEEEKAISEYIRNKKVLKRKTSLHKKSIRKPKKALS